VPADLYPKLDQVKDEASAPNSGSFHKPFELASVNVFKVFDDPLSALSRPDLHDVGLNEASALSLTNDLSSDSSSSSLGS
jgi:hypothetical protein